MVKYKRSTDHTVSSQSIVKKHCIHSFLKKKNLYENVSNCVNTFTAPTSCETKWLQIWTLLVCMHVPLCVCSFTGGWRRSVHLSVHANVHMCLVCVPFSIKAAIAQRAWFSTLLKATLTSASPTRVISSHYASKRLQSLGWWHFETASPYKIFPIGSSDILTHITRWSLKLKAPLSRRISHCG